MKISLLVVGKTTENILQQQIDMYLHRIQRYMSCQLEVIPALKSTKKLSKEEIKYKEGMLILNKLQPTDIVVLLDEKGKEYTSLQFAKYIDKQMQMSTKRLVFVVGGAYGFATDVYAHAHQKIALSKMTFSHQMIRLLFVEQLYRAFTIIKGEPYHHQ